MSQHVSCTRLPITTYICIAYLLSSSCCKAFIALWVMRLMRVITRIHWVGEYVSLSFNNFIFILKCSFYYSPIAERYRNVTFNLSFRFLSHVKCMVSRFVSFWVRRRSALGWARGGAAAAWERGVVVVGAAGERKPVWSESRCRPWASA